MKIHICKEKPCPLQEKEMRDQLDGFTAYYTGKETLRQQIEKLLWEYYNPKSTPNMEELNEKIIELMKPNVGALRQWLNEDRITDKKMVTNEELEIFLL